MKYEHRPCAYPSYTAFCIPYSISGEGYFLGGGTWITIAHATDSMELLFIRMALEAVGIPFLVVGDGFGSLYPGVQVTILNERPIRVEQRDGERAKQVIGGFRTDFDPVSLHLAARCKLRIILEALVFAWFLPGCKRLGSSNKALDSDAGRSRR